MATSTPTTQEPAVVATRTWTQSEMVQLLVGISISAPRGRISVEFDDSQVLLGGPTAGSVTFDLAREDDRDRALEVAHLLAFGAVGGC